MKVSQALVLAVLAFQANAFLDTQKTETNVDQKGGHGGKGGDQKQEGGNGGDGPKSQAGNGGNSGDASGGKGTDFQLSADHKTTGGAAGTNSNRQDTDCNGSCITYIMQSAAGANGGAATDNGQVQLQGPIANTDSSGGKSTAGNGGDSKAQGHGGDGKQVASSEGGKGGDGNKNGDVKGGDNKNSNDLTVPVEVGPKIPGLRVRRYAPGAYEERSAGYESV